MAENRWQDMFLHLKDDGFKAYSPGVKVGECLEPYVVIRMDGSARRNGISTDEDYYYVLCYVPKDNYSFLETYVQNVKKSMKKLMPMIIPLGTQTPSYYDDAVKAHMVSIGYKNYKKMV